MFAATKSLRGNKCAQVFTNGAGYDLFYPLKKESLASEALNEVIRTVGVPKELVSDGARGDLWEIRCSGKGVSDQAAIDIAIQRMAESSRGRDQGDKEEHPEGNTTSAIA
jgi:hypothetical protein